MIGLRHQTLANSIVTRVTRVEPELQSKSANVVRNVVCARHPEQPTVSSSLPAISTNRNVVYQKQSSAGMAPGKCDTASPNCKQSARVDRLKIGDTTPYPHI